MASRPTLIFSGAFFHGARGRSFRVGRGVPQVSVLGLALLILYVGDLAGVHPRVAVLPGSSLGWQSRRGSPPDGSLARVLLRVVVSPRSSPGWQSRQGPPPGGSLTGSFSRWQFRRGSPPGGSLARVFLRVAVSPGSSPG